MRVKKLNLWELNNYSYKFPTNLTSVLNSRAGVKSSHYNYLYSSRDSSVERNVASPGVTAILKNEYSSVKNLTQKPETLDDKRKDKEEKTRASFLMNLRKRLTSKSSTNSNSNIKIVDSSIPSHPVQKRVFVVKEL